MQAITANRPRHERLLPVLVDTGAISPTAAGGWRKTLHDRLIFPLTDEHGRVRGWTGRDLTGRPGAPRWMDSPGRRTRCGAP